MTISNHSLWTFVRILVLALFLTSSKRCLAQDYHHVGTVEVGVLAGSTAGEVGSVYAPTDNPSRPFNIGGHGNAAVGLNVGRVASQRIILVGEVQFLSGGRESQPIANGFTVNTSVRNIVYQVGVNFKILQRNARMQPYLASGAGTIQTRGDALFEYVGAPSSVPAAAATRYRISRGQFAGTFGVGFRYYLSSRFAFRAEARGYAPTGQATGACAAFLGGFLVQFR